MAVVGIFSAIFCRGKEVADWVAQLTGLECLEDRLLEETSQRFGKPAEKFERALRGQTLLFNRFHRERFINLARLRLVLAELIQKDNVIVYGPASHLLPRTVSHILKIFLNGNIKYRIGIGTETGGISAKEARKIIRRSDMEDLKLTEFVSGKPPYNSGLYDLIYPMHRMPVEEVVAEIGSFISSDLAKTTPSSRKAVKDLILAARVNIALAEAGLDGEVLAADGLITIEINNYVIRFKSLAKAAKRVASDIDDVREVSVKAGDRYQAPNINPFSVIKDRQRLTLFGEESEYGYFVSDRLRADDIKSSVIYDARQAMEIVRKEKPDVIVLDLMSPEEDGLDALQQIKKEYARAEIIILSNRCTDENKAVAKDQGAYACLQKPVDVAVLSRIMRNAHRKVCQMHISTRNNGGSEK